MHLLPALSSTTSPLAMQAMPLVAQPTGDFAALIAGMVPAGDAMAAPVERQAAAPGGNGLPVAIAAPVALVDAVPVAPPDGVTPVPPSAPVPGTLPPVALSDAMPAVAPPLPVSATEAVLMLPPETDAPAATPMVAQAAPVLAAIGALAEVLPEKETVDAPPRAEDLAVRTLPMPVPTRFAAPQPRVKRTETATREDAPVATEDKADEPDQVPHDDAVVPSSSAPVPHVEPQPAEALMLPAAPLPADAVPADEPATKPAVSLVIEQGKVVATEPATVATPPMRAAKRSVDPVPMEKPTKPPAVEPEPAVGVVSALNTDSVVPVHVVVPPVANDAAPVPAPQVMSRASFDTAAVDIEPVATGPVVAVAPGDAAPVMIDAPVPASFVPPVAEAETTVRSQPAIETRITRQPPQTSMPAPRPVTPEAERRGATAIPPAVPNSPAPVPEATAADRKPIAGEAAASVIPVAVPMSPPAVAAAPVTRIAPAPLPDAAPIVETNADSAATTVRMEPGSPAVPATAPPVIRVAPAPAPDAVPVVDMAPGDTDTPSPRPRRDEDPAVPTTGGSQAPDAALLRPVVPTGQSAQAALDTRQPQWVEGMIERITTLRESGGTDNGETRIRLSPDALGDVEVAIRTGDDGKLHVHFASENADAGRLLADAQPRLVQMAEARGLKLGGMQVDVGSQQSPQSQRQAQDQGNAAPRAPRSAASQANTQTTRSTDRIA